MKKLIFCLMLSLVFCCVCVGIMPIMFVHAEETQIEEVVEEPKQEVIEEEPAEETPSEEPKENEWLNNIKTYIISALVSMAGTFSAILVFVKVLKKMVDKIRNYETITKADIETLKNSVIDIIQEAKKEQEFLNKEWEKFENEKAEFYQNANSALVLIGCGFKELVANGTAEKVKELFDEKTTDKGI